MSSITDSPIDGMWMDYDDIAEFDTLLDDAEDAEAKRANCAMDNFVELLNFERKWNEAVVVGTSSGHVTPRKVSTSDADRPVLASTPSPDKNLAALRATSELTSQCCDSPGTPPPLHRRRLRSILLRHGAHDGSKSSDTNCGSPSASRLLRSTISFLRTHEDVMSSTATPRCSAPPTPQVHDGAVSRSGSRFVTFASERISAGLAAAAANPADSVDILREPVKLVPLLAHYFKVNVGAIRGIVSDTTLLDDLLSFAERYISCLGVISEVPSETVAAETALFDNYVRLSNAIGSIFLLVAREASEVLNSAHLRRILFMEVEERHRGIQASNEEHISTAAATTTSSSSKLRKGGLQLALKISWIPMIFSVTALSHPQALLGTEVVTALQELLEIVHDAYELSVSLSPSGCASLSQAPTPKTTLLVSPLLHEALAAPLRAVNSHVVSCLSFSLAAVANAFSLMTDPDAEVSDTACVADLVTASAIGLWSVLSASARVIAHISARFHGGTRFVSSIIPVLYGVHRTDAETIRAELESGRWTAANLLLDAVDVLPDPVQTAQQASEPSPLDAASLATLSDAESSPHVPCRVVRSLTASVTSLLQSLDDVSLAVDAVLSTVGMSANVLAMITLSAVLAVKSVETEAQLLRDELEAGCIALLASKASIFQMLREGCQSQTQTAIVNEFKRYLWEWNILIRWMSSLLPSDSISFALPALEELVTVFSGFEPYFCREQSCLVAVSQQLHHVACSESKSRVNLQRLERLVSLLHRIQSLIHDTEVDGNTPDTLGADEVSSSIVDLLGILEAMVDWNADQMNSSDQVTLSRLVCQVSTLAAQLFFKRVNTAARITVVFRKQSAVCGDRVVSVLCKVVILILNHPTSEESSATSISLIFHFAQCIVSEHRAAGTLSECFNSTTVLTDVWNSFEAIRARGTELESILAIPLQLIESILHVKLSGLLEAFLNSDAVLHELIAAAFQTDDSDKPSVASASCKILATAAEVDDVATWTAIDRCAVVPFDTILNSCFNRMVGITSQRTVDKTAGDDSNDEELLLAAITTLWSTGVTSARVENIDVLKQKWLPNWMAHVRVFCDRWSTTDCLCWASVVEVLEVCMGEPSSKVADVFRTSDVDCITEILHNIPSTTLLPSIVTVSTPNYKRWLLQKISESDHAKLRSVQAELPERDASSPDVDNEEPAVHHPSGEAEGNVQVQPDPENHVAEPLHAPDVDHRPLHDDEAGGSSPPQGITTPAKVPSVMTVNLDVIPEVPIIPDLHRVESPASSESHDRNAHPPLVAFKAFGGSMLGTGGSSLSPTNGTQRPAASSPTSGLHHAVSMFHSGSNERSFSSSPIARGEGEFGSTVFGPKGARRRSQQLNIKQVQDELETASKGLALKKYQLSETQAMLKSVEELLRDTVEALAFETQHLEMVRNSLRVVDPENFFSRDDLTRYRKLVSIEKSIAVIDAARKDQPPDNTNNNNSIPTLETRPLYDPVSLAQAMKHASTGLTDRFHRCMSAAVEMNQRDKLREAAATLIAQHQLLEREKAFYVKELELASDVIWKKHMRIHELQLQGDTLARDAAAYQRLKIDHEQLTLSCKELKEMLDRGDRDLFDPAVEPLDKKDFSHRLSISKKSSSHQLSGTVSSLSETHRRKKKHVKDVDSSQRPNPASDEDEFEISGDDETLNNSRGVAQQRKPRPTTASHPRVTEQASTVAAARSGIHDSGIHDDKDIEIRKLQFGLKTASTRIQRLQKEVDRLLVERNSAICEAVDARQRTKFVELMHKSDVHGMTWAQQRMKRLEREKESSVSESQRSLDELNRVKRASDDKVEAIKLQLLKVERDREQVLTTLALELDTARIRIAEISTDNRRKDMVISQLTNKLDLLRSTGAASVTLRSGHSSALSAHDHLPGNSHDASTAAKARPASAAVGRSRNTSAVLSPPSSTLALDVENSIDKKQDPHLKNFFAWKEMQRQRRMRQ